jgi:hypothetical protein
MYYYGGRVEGQPDEEKLKNWSGRGTGATTARKSGGVYKGGIQELLQGGGVLQGRDTSTAVKNSEGWGGSKWKKIHDDNWECLLGSDTGLSQGVTGECLQDHRE